MYRSADSLFLGSQVAKIDGKGRIAAPADFRRALDRLRAPDESRDGDRFSGFFATPSLDGPFLDCGGPEFIERLQAIVAAYDPYDPEGADFREALIGRSRTIHFDGDGRFILPQPLKDFAGIDGEAYFIGLGAIFQIRSAQGAEARMAGAVDRAVAARRNLKNPASPPFAEGRR